ncbi:MAG: YfiR family protein [Terriglobales bacterium]
MGERDRWLAWVLAIGAVFLIVVQRQGQAQRPSRDDVQAAYLYNFGKFVRWPNAERTPVVVCVAGEDPVGKTIAKLLEGEQIEGRPLAERNVDGPGHVGDCSILYVGAGEQEREDSYLAAAEGKPILTVGAAPDFLAHGGMIQFVMVEDHVRFSVNLDAVNRHRVALSSELLKVAVAVTGKSGTGGAK